MQELQQKHFFNAKTFTLTPAGIKIVSEAIHENSEYFVKYDELGFGIVKTKNKIALVPPFLLSLFFLLDVYLLTNAILDKERSAIVGMWLGSGIFFGICALMAFFTAKKEIVCVTGGLKTIELLSNNPSAQEVDFFINRIHKNMRTFYKTKYALVEKYTPYKNQLDRFNWLRKIEVITKEEFEDLVRQLQKAFSSNINFRNKY